MSAPRARSQVRNGIRAEFIRLRLVSGLRQIDLEVVSGVSERTISNFEAGRNDISLGKFVALVNALGYDLKMERRP